ncbi:VWA domain-containing protein, partial [bacterium]|nr:VWA domain-containing protein [bacterium]
YVTTPGIQNLPLEVKEDKNKVSDFKLDSASELPINFGMVFDVSGSMKADHKLEKAKEAAIEFIELMKSNDKAFLIKFSDAPELVQGLISDRRKLQQEIEYFQPLHGTALYDSVYMGVEMISKVKDRPALVILTDGVDENAARTGPGSVRTLREVVDFAKKLDVQIFSIGLGRELRMRGSKGEGVLRTFSEQTGGSYFFAPSASELEQIFRTVIREVGSQSKLSFVPPSGANDGAWHTIELGIPTRKELTFIYKPTYLAK